jgi:hypothetical protein
MAKKNKIKTLVNHPMDHPDVIAVAKIKKEDREEFEEKYPKFSKLTGSKKDKVRNDTINLLKEKIAKKGWR